MSHRGNNDPIASADAKMQVGKVEGGHARGNANAVSFWAHERREVVFKLMALRSMRQNEPIQHVGDCLTIFIGDPRPAKRHDSLFADGTHT